jgi:hypothetical protein
MTMQKAYKLDQTAYNHTNVSNRTDRDLSAIDLSVNEGVDANKPIASIKFDNYKVNSVSAVELDIIPLFKKRSDYEEWVGSGKFNLIGSPVDTTTDLANDDLMIPANTNYRLEAKSDTEYHLYRKESVNYEEQVRYGFNNTDDRPYFEIVAIRVKYFEPLAQATNVTASNSIGNVGLAKEKTIIVHVRPENVTELIFDPVHNFYVEDGESQVDISQLYDAQFLDDATESHGQIKYYLRGFIDNSGMGTQTKTYLYSNLMAEGETDLSDCFDASAITQMTDTAAGRNTGLMYNANAQWSATNDKELLNVANVWKDLKDEEIYTLYHKNHNNVDLGRNNTKFDNYSNPMYSFFVEARYVPKNTNDSSSCERKLTQVNIHVSPPESEFYIEDPTDMCYKLTETLGTAEENRGESGNNPSIKLSTFLDKIKHEDILNPTTHTDLATNRISIEVVNLDSDLIYVPTGVDMGDHIVKLKDTDANKTTEKVEGGASSELADFNHYNYERKKEYLVPIKICRRNEVEICVEKVPDYYLCDQPGATYDQAKQVLSKFSNLNVDKKTAEFVYKEKDNNGAIQKIPTDDEYDGQQFYFKNPETGKYEGPLSATPQNVDQLKAKKEIFGKKINWAYVRWHVGGSDGYRALYKATGFRDDLDSMPKPADCKVFEFKICVLNGLDKPIECPQPYLLEDCNCYDKADPTLQDNIIQVDNTNHRIKSGEELVSYVYATHGSLVEKYGPNGRDDYKAETPIPSWHPDYTNVGGDIVPIERKVYFPLRMDKENSAYNYGKYTGAKDASGFANGSVNFCKYRETDQYDVVVLDYFIEHHGKIDASGYNEIQESPFFGEQIDYSGTSKLQKNTVGTLEVVPDSDKRLYRLTNIRRDQCDSNEKPYSTGEIKFITGKTAELGKKYCFTVAAVTNLLATENDLSYNTHMVDYNQTHYKKISIGGENYPQPFQKYCYDAKSERVVTKAHWEEYDIHSKVTGINVKTNDNAAYVKDSYVNAENKGVLLVCRTEFEVCVDKDGSLRDQFGYNLNFDSAKVMTANSLDDIQEVAPAGTVRLLNMKGEFKLVVSNGSSWQLA